MCRCTLQTTPGPHPPGCILSTLWLLILKPSRSRSAQLLLRHCLSELPLRPSMLCLSGVTGGAWQCQCHSQCPAVVEPKSSLFCTIVLQHAPLPYAMSPPPFTSPPPLPLPPRPRGCNRCVQPLFESACSTALLHSFALQLCMLSPIYPETIPGVCGGVKGGGGLQWGCSYCHFADLPSLINIKLSDAQLCFVPSCLVAA